MAVTIELPFTNMGQQPVANEVGAEVLRLRSKNPVYTIFEPRWSFYLAAYEGGEEFTAPAHLHKHFRENDEDYSDRAKRLHNMNYCGKIVDFYTNFIFSEPIDRDGGSNDDFYKQFLQDVNLKGDTVEAFMREVSTDLHIYGMSYILVDAPPIPEADSEVVVTKQQELDEGIRPYWVLIKPDEILDWSTDDFGHVTYLKRMQTLVTMNLAGTKNTTERYTEFRPASTLITDIDVTNADRPEVISYQEYTNKLGVIPLVIARLKRSRRYPFVGLSNLRDFAYSNREILNLTSLLQEFLYRQAFNILARETDGNVPLKEQEDGSIGTANIMDVPKGAKFPQYISPPADPAKFIQDERARIKNEMFVMAAQDTLSELFNGEGRSGFSQAQAFSQTVPFIATRADILEGVEENLMELTLSMIGREWDGKIKYKDRYEITNLMDALTQLQVLVRDFQITSESFVKTQLKRMVREFDGKLQPDELERIYKEIDDIDWTDWFNTQKQALVGKGSSGGTSPGEQQMPKDTMTTAEHAKEARATIAGTTSVRNK